MSFRLKIMRGALGFRFCGFGYILDRFFGFCAKRLRFFAFDVYCGLWIFRFFSIWFSGFVNNTSGFSVLVSNVVFGFSYFVLFGLWFLFDLSGNLLSNSREPPKLLR